MLLIEKTARSPRKAKVSSKKTGVNMNPVILRKISPERPGRRPPRPIPRIVAETNKIGIMPVKIIRERLLMPTV